MEVGIFSSSRACETRAIAMIYEGVNELMQAGHETWPLHMFPVNLEGRIIYAVVPGSKEVCGVLTVTPKDRLTLRVTMAYVEPSSRRQHVFYRMHEYLGDQARIEGYSEILYDLHPANAGGRHALGTLKAKPLQTTYRVAV